MDPNTPNPQPDPAIQAELERLKNEVADVDYLRKELAAVKAQVRAAAGGGGAVVVTPALKDVQDRLDRLTNPAVRPNGHVLSKSLRMPSRLSRPDELATAAVRDVAKAYPSGQKKAQKFIQ